MTLFTLREACFCQLAYLRESRRVSNALVPGIRSSAAHRAPQASPKVVTPSPPSSPVSSVVTEVPQSVRAGRDGGLFESLKLRLRQGGCWTRRLILCWRRRLLRLAGLSISRFRRWCPLVQRIQEMQQSRQQDITAIQLDQYNMIRSSHCVHRNTLGEGCTHATVANLGNHVYSFEPAVRQLRLTPAIPAAVVAVAARLAFSASR